MKGQQAAEVAVFVEDGRFVDAVLAENRHDLHDIHRFGHEDWLLDARFDEGFHGHVFPRMDGVVIFLEDHVDRNHAEKFVERAPADGQVDVIEGDHFIHNRLVGIFYVNPVNLGAVGHNIADVHIGQAEYAVYQLGLFLFESAQLCALLQKDFDFLFRYGLHLRLAHADDLRHQGRRSRQKPNEGRTDRTEIQHRPGQKAGDGFRLVDGDALRHDFP